MRYGFLSKHEIYEALNNLSNALLAAKDGHEVEKIMRAILTNDERIKIGRRIIIAKMLVSDMGYDEIASEYRVGKDTIKEIQRRLDQEDTAKGFGLIFEREDKMEKEFKKKAYTKVGSSLQVFKKTEYTGFKRKDVKR